MAATSPSSSSDSAPPPPALPTPDTSDDRYPLWLRVREALQTLPLYFESKTMIEGIEAGDLFSLNAVLGSTIEVQVVTALNRIRDTWDPPTPGSTVGEYADYGFVRMPQSYPDVRLQKAGDPGSVLLGLELKGWYLLSKEREPSYRFTATPMAASEWDLLVVVPWYLSNVLSGTPVVLEPFVRPARWAAEYRNWYWEWKRRNPRGRPQETRGVKTPPGVTPPPPYPAGKTEMSDTPIEDAGGNFGRLSRAGIMDEYIERLLDVPVSGIAGSHWIDFFTIFTESSTRGEITDALRSMAASMAASAEPTDDALRAVALVRELLAVVGAAEASDVDDDATDAAAIRAAVEGRRQDLERLARAAAKAGVDRKEVAKLGGFTPSRLEKLLATEAEEAAVVKDAPADMPPGDVSG